MNKAGRARLVSGRITGVILALLAVIVIAGCRTDNDPTIDRAVAADKEKNHLLIGAIASWEAEDADMWNGIAMAVREVNEGKGVLGRKIRVLKRDDYAAVTSGQIAAQEMVDTPELIAVVGPWHSFVAEPASLFFSFHGIVNISFGSSDRLSQRGLEHFFRLGFSHAESTSLILEHLLQQGIRRVVIINDVREDHNLLAASFERQAGRKKVKLLERFEYDTSIDPDWWEQTTAALKRTESLGAVIIAGMMPAAAELVREIRRTGFSGPIYSSGKLDIDDFCAATGAIASPAFACLLFPPVPVKPVTSEFMQRYQELYQAKPTEDAALGYDSIMMLVTALEKVGQPHPRLLAEHLRNIHDYQGVSGNISFDHTGESADRSGSVRLLQFPQ